MASGLAWHKEMRDLAARFFAELSGLDNFSVTTHSGISGPLIHFHITPTQEEYYGRGRLQVIGHRVADSIVSHYRLTEEKCINNPGVSIIVTHENHE